MKIAILGAGHIGGGLGKGWAAAGHAIRFGVRKPDELSGLVKECGHDTQATDPRSAAAFAEVVALAVPWAAVDDMLAQAGDLSGKVLIDCTNAVSFKDGVKVIAAPSAAESIAARAKGARVVKAFNQMGAERLTSPKVGGVAPDVFICGDDPQALKVTRSLAEALGFGVVEAGGLKNARLVEELAALWIQLAMGGGLGRNIAFKLLRS